MDDPQMLPLYAYLAEAHLPVCFHVNPAKPGFMDEFVAVLQRFPDLKVNTPHFMLSSMVHARLREMFAAFPNLVVDISFGHDDYLQTGLQRIAYRPESFRDLLADHPERFLFGTDFVVTSLRPHDHAWYDVRMQAYLDMLSKSTYTTSLLPGRTLQGLALDPPLLERIFYRNFDRFTALTPTNTVLTHTLRWSELRIRRVERAPGEAIPPPPRRGRRRG
jgi:predicted TIM-barrel fold metal-dependent hydrolase